MKKNLLEQFRTGLVDKSLKWPSRWAEKKIWMPSPFEGNLSFMPFPWLPGILNIMEGQVSVMKGSQLGCSVIAMVKALFAAIELRDEAMIVQPTAKAAGAFTQSRLNALLALSPALQGSFAKSDSVFMKTTMHHSHIFIRGSISEADLTSQPVSLAVIDEFDRCNINCLALIQKRMSARDMADRHVFVLSTPLLPDMGVDAEFSQGTQERFRFKCPGCSRHISLEWPDCIEACGDHPKDPDVWKSYFKCSKCGKKLDFDERGVKEFAKYMTKPWLEEAAWEADATAQFHRSFYIPQMYGPRVRAGEIVVESMHAEVSEPKKVQFINQTIGLPYIAAGARLNEKIINDCLGSHKMTDDAPATSERMIVMGIDTGSMLDCVITEYIYDQDPGFDPIGASIAKVLQVKRIPRSEDGWKQLDWLMTEYSVHHAVIDFQPETTPAEAFAGRFYKGVSLNQYRKGTQGTDVKCKINENKVPILTTDRTSFMDTVFNRFHKGRIILPADCDFVFKEHLLAPIRTYEYDEFDRPKAVYVKAQNSADHLAHSLLLCEIAHLRAYVQSSGRSVGGDDSIRQF
jgi:hypothetical protein